MYELLASVASYVLINSIYVYSIPEPPRLRHAVQVRNTDTSHDHKIQHPILCKYFVTETRTRLRTSFANTGLGLIVFACKTNGTVSNSQRRNSFLLPRLLKKTQVLLLANATTNSSGTLSKSRCKHPHHFYKNKLRKISPIYWSFQQ